MLESTPSANLLNPFGIEWHEEQEEETQHEIPLNAQSNSLASSLPITLELEELVDHETTQKNGLDSMVDVNDGKCIHKAKVLCEFMRFTRSSNLTDHLRHITNISHFTQTLSTTWDHHISDDCHRD